MESVQTNISMTAEDGESTTSSAVLVEVEKQALVQPWTSCKENITDSRKSPALHTVTGRLPLPSLKDLRL